ncbi:beta-eliminating lyase-related protein [Sphaerisporangium sp. B11E5]|uniref:threonine aldolase family protein n=1 Tax=Sphaerisporangium sp. B11E5 TaxID=3153563 RepID=UPI00325E57DE
MDPAEVRRSCRRSLSDSPRHNMRERLLALAARPEAGSADVDVYGQGGPVAEVERRVAGLLGKPAARWVSTGVIAQQAALRTWTDRTGRPVVALHPLSHIDRDEGSAYERLHGLRPVRVGDLTPYTVEDLERAAETPGVVTVELPLRFAGLLLPAWDDLVAISRWCRERRIPLHFDGARLWESAPHYRRPLTEIAALADSVYVSFYKSLGGLGGAALTGDPEFLSECAPWLSRHGAQPFHSYPYALAALAGLDTTLPKLPGFTQRAITLAAAMSEIDGVYVTPRPPHVNAFHLYLPGPPDVLSERHLTCAATHGDWLFSHFWPTSAQGQSVVEIRVTESTAAFTDAEVVQRIASILGR